MNVLKIEIVVSQTDPDHQGQVKGNLQASAMWMPPDGLGKPVQCEDAAAILKSLDTYRDFVMAQVRLKAPTIFPMLPVNGLTRLQR